MIKRNIWGVLLLSLFVSFSTISCSSDDNSTDPKKEQEPEKDKDKDKEGGTDTDQDGDKDKDKDSKVFYAHKVLLEDFTGTWCGYCPLVAYDIEQMEAQYPEKFEAVAIHNNDPFDFNSKLRRKYESKVGVKGYPAAFTNRTIDFRQNPNSVQDSHLASSPIGISLKTNLTATGGTVDLTIRFSENYENGIYHTVYILEDGLLADQENYTDLYGGASVLVDFVHNNTLIGLSDGFEGKLIPGIITKEGKEFKRDGIEIAYTAQDVTKLRALVIVTNADGKVLNVLSAKANETKDFVVVE